MVEVVSDMSGAFVSGVKAHFTNSALTVHWFHVVQLFTKAVDEVRRAESKEVSMPKASRWATLKKSEGPFKEGQLDALAELVAMDLYTTNARKVKGLLRWVRKAASMRAAKWRLVPQCDPIAGLAISVCSSRYAKRCKP